MVWMSLSSLALAAACTEVTFEFSGQPQCVDLAYLGAGRVLLTNACAEPVLLDQSVLPTSALAGQIQPGRSLEIVGLNVFTLGVSGTLHRVTAASSTRPCDPLPRPAPSPGDGRPVAGSARAPAAG